MSKIAIVVTTFQSALYIRECLTSLPLGEDVNLYIFDDASQDNTIEVLDEIINRECLPSRLNINESNVGATENLKLALSHACQDNDFVMIMPHDDILGIKDISSITKSIENDESIVMTNQTLLYFDESGILKVHSPLNLKHLGAYAFCVLFHYNTVTAPGSVIRSKVFHPEYLGKNSEHTQDYSLALRLSLRGLITSSPYNFMKYRKHPASLSEKSSYKIAHIESYEFLLEILDSAEFTNFVSGMKMYKRRLFAWLIFFLGWEKPYCSHLNSLEIKLCQKLQIEFKSKRKLSGICEKKRGLVSVDKKGVLARIRLKIMVYLICKSVIFRKIMIELSTITFLVKRTLRCLQYRFQGE